MLKKIGMTTTVIVRQIIVFYSVKKLKLTPQPARRLHDAITKKGLGIDEIMDLAMTLFGKGPR